jgi:hypothetical protein
MRHATRKMHDWTGALRAALSVLAEVARIRIRWMRGCDARKAQRRVIGTSIQGWVIGRRLTRLYRYTYVYVRTYMTLSVWPSTVHDDTRRAPLMNDSRCILL